MTELREWYKASGICVACGQEDAVQGLLPRYMFGNGDYCSTCGKPVNGTKLCPKCKADAQRTIEIARQHIQSGWRYETFVFGKKSL